METTRWLTVRGAAVVALCWLCSAHAANAQDYWGYSSDDKSHDATAAVDSAAQSQIVDNDSTDDNDGVYNTYNFYAGVRPNWYWRARPRVMVAWSYGDPWDWYDPWYGSWYGPSWGYYPGWCYSPYVYGYGWGTYPYAGWAVGGYYGGWARGWGYGSSPRWTSWVAPSRRTFGSTRGSARGIGPVVVSKNGTRQPTAPSTATANRLATGRQSAIANTTNAGAVRAPASPGFTSTSQGVRADNGVRISPDKTGAATGVRSAPSAAQSSPGLRSSAPRGPMFGPPPRSSASRTGSNGGSRWGRGFGGGRGGKSSGGRGGGNGGGHGHR